jgi:hypothetical protein
MEIEGFPNYLIYEDGRVFNKKRKNYLKPHLIKDGYLRVTLWGDNKKKSFLIHRLLALHFIENPDNKPEVDHIDRNRTNNNLDNLRWVTREENIKNTNFLNQFNERFISYHKKYNRFVFQICRNDTKIYKKFELFEDAIIFRDIYCFENDIDLD